MKITYINEKTVEADKDQRLLDISLAHGIPHTHVCGGNARCSTCRIIVTEGAQNLSVPGEEEAALALRKGFPPDIRLACRAVAHGDVSIRRLVIDQEDIQEIIGTSIRTTGRELDVAVLFSDIRGFTTFSERHLPYDVVHLLNRYFREMGDAVVRHGGLIDKYMGDGLMALFGLGAGDGRAACLAAVRAAKSMLNGLESVNAYMRRNYQEEFKIGIGIHFGEVIAGEMGHPKKMQFTALGDTVNTASRIESATKKAGASLLVSDAAYNLVSKDVQRGRIFSAPLKGKAGKFKLFEILGVTPAAESAQELFQLPVLHKAAIASDTVALHLDTSLNDFPFKPGQFIEVTLPALEGTAGQASRIFSVASSPHRSDSIMIATRIRKSLYKQTLAALEEGAPLWVSEPAGHLVPPEPGARPVVFIAGGMGITVCRSLIEYLLHEEPDRPLYLLMSNRNLESAAFLDEMESWAMESAHLHVTATLTETVPPGWKFEKGRMDKLMLQRHLPLTSHAVFYVAGPPRMVASTHELLLSLFIPDTDIHLEEFLGY